MDTVDKKVLTTLLAATAMHAIVSSTTAEDKIVPKVVAANSFHIAEAMMAEAEKRGHV